MAGSPVQDVCAITISWHAGHKNARKGKMLAQQLRQIERDGLVPRTVFPQAPPQVDYRLKAWGRRCALCWMRCSPGEARPPAPYLSP